MSLPAADVSHLIRRIRDGSDSALGPLLNGYREYLLRIATDRIGSGVRPKMAPSDVVQGSMLAATRDIKQFRGHTENQFRTWLVSILTNQIIDGLRRFTEAEKRRTDRELTRGNNVVRGIADAGDSPSQLASLQDDAAKLLSVIQSLPDQQQAIVHAHYLEGQTFVEIGRRLEIPVTTCRRHWLDAIESISRQMETDS